ncbi:choice-of-anchor D domain-containing protein [Vulgatibacter sp.]|uniref:choice-of-anchor D domain-containing protein n=1 Tax=Vulgatibacter sp. TaxID=1971226 RepID=UPI003564B625
MPATISTGAMRIYRTDFVPTRLAALLLLGLLTACSDPAAEEPAAGCAAHTACDSGLCDTGTGRCLPASTALVPIATPGEETDLLLDFGAVRVGAEARLQLAFRNDAPVALEATLAGLEGPFSAAVTSIVVEPGQEGVLELTYEPAAAGRDETIVTVASHRTNWALELKGRGAAPSLDCPEALDFGFAIGPDTRSRTLRCANDSGLPLVLEAAVTGGGFALTGAETREVEANELFDLEMTFTPVAFGPQAGEIVLREAGGAVLRAIPLTANTRESALLVVDEGCVAFTRTPLGASTEAGIRLRNLATEPLTVRAEVQGSPVFSVPEEITLGVGGTPESEAVLPIHFAPTTRQDHEAVLVLDADGVEQQLCLNGPAGGPRIVCTPSPLELGIHALGLPGSSELTCTNAAAAGASEDVLYVESVTTSGPTLAATIVGGASPTGYAGSESFTLHVTSSPLEPGAFTGHVTVASNDAIAPRLEIPVAGDAIATPGCTLRTEPSSVIDFGSARVGTPVEADVLLENTGTDPCVLVQQPFDDLGIYTLELPRMIDPGKSALARATFAPQLLGGREAQFAFRVSDPARSSRTLWLYGVAETSCVEWSVQPFDMGAARLGCSSEVETIRATNGCLHAVPVEAIEIAGAPALFTATAGATLPMQLAPGASLEVQLQHHAPLGLDGTAGAGIWLRNGQAAVSRTLQVQSTANDGAVAEHFTFAGRELDILWVIDTGVGMAGVQDAIADQLAHFLAPNLGAIDWRMAVTRADGSGQLHRGSGAAPTWLDDSMSDFATRFSEYVHQGSAGARALGLESLYRALPHLAPRPGAQLAVVFVSDVEDQSPETSNFYANAAAFAGYERVTFHAITGGATGCGSAEPENHYSAMLGGEGGWMSICSTSWQTDFAGLGAVAFELPAFLHLRDPPSDVDADGIVDLELLHQGTVLEPTDGMGTVQWTLPDPRRIRIEPVAAPSPGDLLEVRYQLECF